MPMPVPGDVVVMYMGNQLRSKPLPAWLPVWAGMVADQVLGSLNLFLLSRHFGRDLPNTRLGRLLHVDERRMKQAEAWFQKWGPWVLVFGSVEHLLDLYRGNYVLLPVLLALAVVAYVWYRRQHVGSLRV